MKKIKINLSKQSIEYAIKDIEKLQGNLEKVNSEIVDALAEYGLNEIQKNYSQADIDGNNDVSFFKSGSNNHKSIGVRGSQVLYREFGTGTEGAKVSHPKKSEFGLKGYNTGRTIRKASPYISAKSGIMLGEQYWTYSENGEIIYTEGIAGNQGVYKASRSIRKIKDKIIKQKVGDALSKL